MKRTFKSKLMVAVMATLFTVRMVAAQAPQLIPFQAVARDSKGVVMANKTLALRFSVLDGPNNSPTLDATAYQETQIQTTNTLGLFMANIGQGTVVSGSFASINWGTYNKYVQVEMDITGSGANYITIATQQLMSVPYALNSTKADNGVPVGTIEAFAGAVSALPTGWLLCDGRTVNRSTYPNLFSVIGIQWGAGDGTSATFRLPDTRGYFLRGLDNSTNTGVSGNDPDINSRVPAWGGISGNNVGTYESDQFASHTHTQNPHAHNIAIAINIGGTINEVTGGSGGVLAYSTSVCTSTTATNQNTGGSETRPKNAAVNYIIKY